MTAHRVTVDFTLPLDNPRRRGYVARQPAAVGTRVPRATRALVEAHRFRARLEAGEVQDLAALARAEGLTRARVTQILGLTLLAPDIQEEILLLPRVLRGQEPIPMQLLRAVARLADWDEQRRLWRAQREAAAGAPEATGGTALARRTE